MTSDGTPAPTLRNANQTSEPARAHQPHKEAGATPHNWAMITRFLRDWLWPRRLKIITVLAVTGLLALVTGGYPLIIKMSFDSLLDGRDDALALVLTAVIAVTALRSVLLYSQAVLSARLVIRMATDLRTTAFQRLMALDFASLTAEPPGNHVSRLTNEINFIETATQAALNTAIKDSLSVLVLVGTMFYLDWVMSLVILLVYPIAFWPIVAVSNRLRRVAKRTQSQLGDMTSLLSEKFSAVRLIKSYRLEDYASRRASDSFEDVYRLRLKAVGNKAKIDPILEGLGGIAVAGVIGLAYWRISQGNATVGDFMGFVSALLMAAQPIRGLGNLSARLQEGLAAVEKFYQLVDQDPKIVDRPGAPQLDVEAASITFEKASFYYPGTVLQSGSRDNASPEETVPPAIDRLDLVIPGGTTTAFVGRSGAGKSTLINLVPRLFDVTSGRIMIDGADIRNVSLDSLRNAMALVSQDVTLFDDTIGANIALGRLGATQRDIEAAAHAAAAHGFILTQPDGYNTRIGPSGQRLSGGQRQRLALARAILKDAPILLLDEATSALDTESERLVQQALSSFTKNRTTLVIAHRLSTVQSADMIVVMSDGRIMETGTHSDLSTRDGPYAELCRSQLLTAEADERKTEAATG